MKPEDWDSMSVKQKKSLAEALAHSYSGRCVIGKALAIASIELQSRGDDSNREKMEMLGEMIFKDGYSAELYALFGHDE